MTRFLIALILNPMDMNRKPYPPPPPSAAGGFFPQIPMWTVSKLTQAIKSALENSFPLVSVEGEVSNCRPSGAGHIYFTLKDSGAVIQAVLFRGRAARVRQLPSDGMQVIITGKIDVYPPRGSYQLIAENVEPAGRGALLEALERRKEALAAEGLFSQERKKPLPPYPRRVAVITSPAGAAVRDILKVLSRRAAAPRVSILPCLVQGAEAPAQIASMLRFASKRRLGDVIILARGGGSIEDLLAFSDEEVVRAVGESVLPVISGIGHETDISLADLAADVRAATPSAAAELVSDRSEDLLIRSRGFRRDTGSALSVRLSAVRTRLVSKTELQRNVSGRMDTAARDSDEARLHLNLAASKRLDLLRHRLELTSRTLSEASPRSVLKRGFARISRDEVTITNAAELHKDDNIQLIFADGAAEAVVTQTPKTSQRTER